MAAGTQAGSQRDGMNEAETALPGNRGFSTLRVGAALVTALHDGTVLRDRPEGFVHGVPDTEVEAAFAAAGSPPGKFLASFTPLLVRLGGRCILIDSGNGQEGPEGTGRLVGNLAALGLSCEAIDTVFISHFHGDHIRGLLRRDGSPTFPGARILVPGPEWAFWMAGDAEAQCTGRMPINLKIARDVFGALGDRVEQVAWGAEAAPGLTTVATPGHAPGHTSMRIASEGESLLYMGDVTNNPAIFARHPDWVAGFDNRPKQMLETRHRILSEAAESGERVHFFHAAFPGFGTLARDGNGYAFRPLHGQPE